jgi:hypothetical protein
LSSASVSCGLKRIFGLELRQNIDGTQVAFFGKVLRPLFRIKPLPWDQLSLLKPTTASKRTSNL